MTANKNKGKTAFGLVVGMLYLIFGLAQVFTGLGFGAEAVEALYISGDFLDGFVLVVIGAVFLYGFKEQNAGINEGAAYIYVGILLALLFTAIYLLVMGADALSAYGLGSEDFEEWTPLDDMRPAIYLGILSFIGLLKWKSKFTLRGISKAGV